MGKNLNMNGPFELSIKVVDENVKKDKIGNYALGYEKNNVFYVCYVGRSDNDLNKRIKDHIGENSKYKCFKYSYADNVKDAYEKECKNWHEFGGENGSLINEIHPDKPNDKDCNCPICGE